MAKRLATLVVAVLGLGGVLVAASAAGDNNAGFHTSVAPLLKGVNGSTVKPIISVGDTLGSGYSFEAIPDGISISRINGKGTVDILVNHELSKVPFPATRQDHLNALLSKIRLHQKSAGVLKGEFVIPSSAGYHRFCSNFLVGKEHGFDRQLLFTNEEARDIVLRQEDSWHAPGVSLTEPNAEQAGVVVAYDVKSGQYRSIYGMGRHNHENSVAVPGYGKPVVLSGDDTFDAPSSQLYMYVAPSGDAVWNDTGKLYAFVSDDPTQNDYGDVTVGETITGHWLEVPRAIATGKLNGREITSADFGYPPGPFDGPQRVLELWSNEHNVFQFIRIEDTAYDRNNPKIHYLADSGEPRAVPSGTRLGRGPSGTQGAFPNGRMWKLELAAGDPLGQARLSILPNANFDDAGYNQVNTVHQPDNVETTKGFLYIQEDPGSHQQFAGASNARIWQYNLATGALKVVAEVDQEPGPTDQPPGSWESSGIVDASAVFGAGAFLVDVQAHGWDTMVPGGNDPPAVQQREMGQLLLLKVPGEGVNAPPGIGKTKGSDNGKAKGHANGNNGKGKAKGRK